MGIHHLQQQQHLQKRQRLSKKWPDNFILLLTFSVFLGHLQLITCCGDSGSGGIIEEREWAEAPLSLTPNIRSLSRRSTDKGDERKACENGNSEPDPLIRYVNP